MSRASVPSVFAPDLDYEDFDDELAGLLRCIVWAFNELNQAFYQPKKLESVLFLVRLRQEEDWEEDIVHILSKVEDALLEIRGAIVEGDPIRWEPYHFDLDRDEYETTFVQFFDDLAERLNDLRIQIIRSRSTVRQRPLFDVMDEDDPIEPVRSEPAEGPSRSFRPFAAVVFDPIATFRLNRERLSDPAYRRRERKRLLAELQLTDDGLLELGDRKVTRNELVDGFDLLDMGEVRAYLGNIYESDSHRQLWMHGAASAYDTEDWKAKWLELVDHPVHVQFRVRWQVQWASAVQAAFEKPVNVERFRELIAFCEADPSFGIACYEPVLAAASHLQMRLNELAEAVEDESTDQHDIDALLRNAARFRLVGCLPVSCNRVKSQCAHALYQLSVQLHNSGCSGSRPLQCLELARDITTNCEVGTFYRSELDKLKKIQASGRDWELITKFGAALQTVLKAVEKERPWSSIRETIEAIHDRAFEAVQAANRLSVDEDEDTTEMLDAIARMLLIVAARAFAFFEGRRFVLALLEAANSIKCSPEVKAEVQSSLVNARKSLPRAGVGRITAGNRQTTLRTESNVNAGDSAELGCSTAGVFWFLVCIAISILLAIAITSDPPQRSGSTRPEAVQRPPNSPAERGREAQGGAVQLAVSEKRAEFPVFQGELPSGRNELTVDNRGRDVGVQVMVRSGGQGKVFWVNRYQQMTVSLPPERYEIFFIYDDDRSSLYQGDSFSLQEHFNTVDTITIILQQRIGGNYQVRKIN